MIGDRLDAGCQTVRVLRAHGLQSPENDEVESALQELDRLRVFTSLSSSHESTLRAARLECQVDSDLRWTCQKSGVVRLGNAVGEGEEDIAREKLHGRLLVLHLDLA